MKNISSILANVPDRLWTVIFNEANNQKWIKLSWYNLKFYYKSKIQNGNIEQINLKKKKEIPYQRKLFYPSPNGRFSLGNGCVAYFSNNSALNVCETIDKYRYDDLLMWDPTLHLYFDGKENPTKSLFGYPIVVKLAPESVLLDLSKKSNSLIKYILSFRYCENFYEDCILSKDEDTYILTQQIAKVVFAKGFDGIVYKSVRQPNDVILVGENLVVLNQNIIKRNKRK